MDQVTAFLDTNIFLHYQPVTQIPWLDLLDCDTAELAIAQLVLEELDEHKNQGRTPRIQDRAREATKLVLQAVRGQRPESFPEEITPIFVEEPSGFNYEAAHLSQHIGDDRLVATILAYRDEFSDSDVRLISGDATPRAKVISHGLDAYDLPGNYRAESLTPTEKKLRKLQEEKREREASTPDPQLVVLNGAEGGHLKAEIEPVDPIPEDKIDREVDRMSGKFHELADGRLRSAGNSTLGVSVRAMISDDERERYRRDFDRWLDDYGEYLRQRHVYKQMVKRSVEVRLGIRNTGKVPARDIDVTLHVSGEVDVWSESDWPAKPEKPEPPHKPRTWQEKMDVRLNQTVGDLAFLGGGGPHQTVSEDLSKSEWEIRESDSAELSAWLRQVKQEVTEELPPFWVMYPGDVEPATVTVSWTLRIDNVPGTRSGEFPVVVNES